MDTTETALMAAFNAGQSLVASKTIYEDERGRKIYAVPSNTRDIVLEPLLPKLIAQQIVLHDEPSTITYANRFKTDATQIFAEPGFIAEGGKAKVDIIFDYHKPEQAQRGSHAVRYVPRYSDAWMRWIEIEKRGVLGQAEFAELIEECRADIVEPQAAPLLDIVRAFKANRKVEFDSLVYQPNGDLVLAYSDKTEQTGTSGKVPEIMKLGIPVYFGGSAYAVPVFIRYRVSGGTVKFQLKRDRPDLVETDAFDGIVRNIATATGIASYLGHA